MVSVRAVIIAANLVVSVTLVVSCVPDGLLTNVARLASKVVLSVTSTTPSITVARASSLVAESYKEGSAVPARIAAAFD
jgi:hypothetical protein